jgi:NCAIR mutase (PurE)-related protein
MRPAPLNTCASGVTAVNIHPEEFGDGFGAGYAASLINQLGAK